MTSAVSFDELLGWNHEAAIFWRSHLEANPAILLLPCGIGGNADVQGLVRHIWGAEMLWSQRAAGLAQRNKDLWPTGPLTALFDMHLEAQQNFRALLENPATAWDEPMVLSHLPLQAAAAWPSRRKIVGHALLHSPRHWAQLSSLVRAAGFPSGFQGDLIFSSALA